MTKSELKKNYDLNREYYERVCTLGKTMVEKTLKEQKVDLLHVSSRVKSFESFYEKISRKKYSDPYREIEDICGLRIVCFYANDLERIDQIIHDTFLLGDFIDKAELQDPDRFGYRANHYIVRLPESEDSYDLSNFKIEVQARTILMHAWAHIQGKLEYKKAEHTPKEFKRKLYQLSAILELADGQFQTLKMEKDALRKLLSAEDYPFSGSTELNIDTFMSFLETHFPDRKKSYRYSKLLLKDLLAQRIGFKEILKSYSKVSDYLADFEDEASAKLTQEQALRVILCIGDPAIFDFMKQNQLIIDHQEIISKWIKQIANSQT